MDWMLQLFATDGFIPSAQCLNYEPATLTVRIIGDLLFALAYLSIPLALERFRRMQLPDMLGSPILLGFIAFIICCSLSHISSIVLIWWPVVRLDAGVRLFGGLVSVYVAMKLTETVGRISGEFERLRRERDALAAQLSESEARLNHIRRTHGGSEPAT